MKLFTKVKNRKEILLNFYQLFPIPLVAKLYEMKTSKPFRSYSNYGEDVVLQGIIRWFIQLGIEINISNLSYIDCGGWHPIKHSNTYWLYKQGNRGTIIEPNINLKPLWEAVRPEDQFHQIAVADGEIVKYYRIGFAGQGSSIKEDWANSVTKSENLFIEDTVLIESKSLGQIIAIHLNKFSSPYLINIDLEGMDYEVIRQTNFNSLAYRPIFVLIEDHNVPEFANDSPIYKQMIKYHYTLISRAVKTSIYIDQNSQEFLKYCSLKRKHKDK